MHGRRDCRSKRNFEYFKGERSIFASQAPKQPKRTQTEGGSSIKPKSFLWPYAKTGKRTAKGSRHCKLWNLHLRSSCWMASLSISDQRIQIAAIKRTASFRASLAAPWQSCSFSSFFLPFCSFYSLSFSPFSCSCSAPFHFSFLLLFFTTLFLLLFFTTLFYRSLLSPYAD